MCNLVVPILYQKMILMPGAIYFVDWAGQLTFIA